jgi:VanZ family protein
MTNSPVTRFLLILAWAALALIAYGTLTRAQFVYAIYGRIKPFLFGASVQTWAHIEHVTAFAIAGILFALAYPRRPWLACMIVAGGAVAFEYLQTFTPDRHGTLIDATEKILAGCLGVGVTSLLRVACSRYFARG